MEEEMAFMTMSDCIPKHYYHEVMTVASISHFNSLCGHAAPVPSGIAAP